MVNIYEYGKALTNGRMKDVDNEIDMTFSKTIYDKLRFNFHGKTHLIHKSVFFYVKLN